MFARLGQAPPPKPVEEIFDGRSLAEVGYDECVCCGVQVLMVL
jgi:hypothetical protein